MIEKFIPITRSNNGFKGPKSSSAALFEAAGHGGKVQGVSSGRRLGLD